MSEVRDAVARAIQAANVNESKYDFSDHYAEAIADAAIVAFLEAIKEQGWQLVPREPTSNMVYQAEGYSDFMLPGGTHDNSHDGRLQEMRMALKVALAAAPEWKP